MTEGKKLTSGFKIGRDAALEREPFERGNRNVGSRVGYERELPFIGSERTLATAFKA
jgi:hypothetical protein